jgi:hypothetical protein
VTIVLYTLHFTSERLLYRLLTPIVSHYAYRVPLALSHLVSENGGQTAGNREVIGELSVRSRSAYGLALWDGSQTSKRCVPLLNVMCTVHHVSDYFNLGSCWASCPCGDQDL